MREYLKVVRAEFSTLSLAVFVISVIAWRRQAPLHLELKTRLPQAFGYFSKSWAIFLPLSGHTDVFPSLTGCLVKDVKITIYI